MNRVVVFGATGQIGFALCRRLLGNGYQVLAVKRVGSPIRFPEGVEILTVPGLDKASIERALTRADYAVYAIGSPEQWHSDKEHFLTVNFGLLRTFLECVAAFPALPIAYVSTFEVFSPEGGRITEANPIAARGATSYYQSMLEGYRLIREFEKKSGPRVVCIHPAAVYGGLNTGRGLTEFLWNLRLRKYWRVPCIPPGSFPVVHVDSLATAIAAAIRGGMCGEGFLISDAQVSLHEISLAAKAVHPGVYVPLEVPLPLIHLSVAAMEMLSALTGVAPIFSEVQVKYITQGLAIDSSKAKARLDWSPMGLREGIARLYGGRDSSILRN